MWLACYTIQKGARKWQRYLVSMCGGGTLGTPVSLTNNVTYTCPSDGYAYINQSTASAGYITINNNKMAIGGPSNVLPVKRGWTLALHESGILYAAQFIPLID